MKRILPLLLFGSLLFASPSQGTDERAVSTRAASAPKSGGLSVLILGPEAVNPGTLVKLDASKSDAESFIWKLAGGTAELYDVAERGRVVYFSSPVPGTYRFLLAVAKNGTPPAPPLLTMAEHVVIVQGAAPVPPVPGPQPPTPPVPAPDPLPTGRYNLARFTRDTVIASGINTAACAGFAANYSVVASQLAAGAIRTLAQCNAELKVRNGAVAGTAIADWKRLVFDKLSAQLTQLVSSGKLNTDVPDDLRDAFSEISSGFAAAGGK